ncbi:hypothetical protein GW17_00033881 [Ensete ventricosum]|nr:hypothetical protein GW17_00033881 [Ensete ventricosum]
MVRPPYKKTLAELLVLGRVPSTIKSGVGMIELKRFASIFLSPKLAMVYGYLYLHRQARRMWVISSLQYLTYCQPPTVMGTIGWSVSRIGSVMPPTAYCYGHCSLVGPTRVKEAKGLITEEDEGDRRNDMAHDDLIVTLSLLRTTDLSTWPTQRGKLVGRRYGGVSGRAVDLAQVRPNPQRLYGRPDTGKADTLTCGRIPHRKDDGRDGGVR